MKEDIRRSFVVIESASEYEPVRMSLKSTAFGWLWLIFARVKRSYDVAGESPEKKRLDTGEGEIKSPWKDRACLVNQV